MPEYSRSQLQQRKRAFERAGVARDTSSIPGATIGIVLESSGAIGTACAHTSLKPIFNYLNACTFGQSEVFRQTNANMNGKSTSVDGCADTNAKSRASRFVGWVKGF